MSGDMNSACLVTWNKLPAFLKATKDERLHKHYRIISVCISIVQVTINGHSTCIHVV